MLEALLAGSPTPPAQAAALRLLADALAPIQRAHRLPAFDLAPGLRLRRRWGQCRHFRDGRRPQVQVRCTDEDRRWRRPAALTLTLLHELAHLRYRSHGPRFWDLLRRLLDDAARAGLYCPGEHDPGETARGDEKLAGSAADTAALAARARRRERAAANRRAARGWAAGQAARVAMARGPLADRVVRVLRVGRGRLTVEAPDGRRYLVAASLLQAIGVDGPAAVGRGGPEVATPLGRLSAERSS